MTTDMSSTPGDPLTHNEAWDELQKRLTCLHVPLYKQWGEYVEQGREKCKAARRVQIEGSTLASVLTTMDILSRRIRPAPDAGAGALWAAWAGRTLAARVTERRDMWAKEREEALNEGRAFSVFSARQTECDALLSLIAALDTGDAPLAAQDAPHEVKGANEPRFKPYIGVAGATWVFFTAADDADAWERAKRFSDSGRVIEAVYAVKHQVRRPIPAPTAPHEVDAGKGIRLTPDEAAAFDRFLAHPTAFPTRPPQAVPPPAGEVAGAGEARNAPPPNDPSERVWRVVGADDVQLGTVRAATQREAAAAAARMHPDVEVWVFLDYDAGPRTDTYGGDDDDPDTFGLPAARAMGHAAPESSDEQDVVPAGLPLGGAFVDPATLPESTEAFVRRIAEAVYAEQPPAVRVGIVAGEHLVTPVPLAMLPLAALLALLDDWHSTDPRESREDFVARFLAAYEAKGDGDAA